MGWKMKVDTWMPLYVADYLADTMRLNCEQHGAYMLLIMDYWRNGPPPDDNLVLASITRCTPDQWMRIRPSLEGHFHVFEGKWHHGRIEAEQDRAKSMVEQRSLAGRASAEAKKRQREFNGRSNPVETGVEQTGKPSPSPKTTTTAPPRWKVVVDAYHAGMPDNPKVKLVTEARKAHVNARWEEVARLAAKPFGYGDDQEAAAAAWLKFFEVCAQNDFLSNRMERSAAHKNFRVDFDWIMNPTNFAKILENRYHG